MKSTLLFFFLLLGIGANAQNTPIGQWETHFSYNSAKSVAYDGDEYMYSADKNLFRYSLKENSFEIFSKINGLSDIDIRLIRYNQDEDYLLIIYENGNIDLLIDNNFINLSNIKNLNTGGSKNINDVFFYNQLAYLSTDFGVVVLNPSRKEIKETYVLQDNSTIAKINSFTNYRGQFIASSDQGLFVVDDNQTVLQDFTKWVHYPNLKFDKIASSPTEGFILAGVDTFHLYSNSDITQSWDTIARTTRPTIRIVIGDRQNYIIENGSSSRKVHAYDNLGTLNQLYFIGINALDLAETGNTFYIADGYSGLTHVKTFNQKDIIRPEGVSSNSAFNLSIANNELFVIGGRHDNWRPSTQRDGVSRYDYKSWRYYSQYTTLPRMDSTQDILDVAMDPRNQYLYFASFGGGLLEIAPDLTTKIYKQNTILQPFGGDNVIRIAGLQFDENNNLWMSNYGVQNSLAVKKADGGFQSYSMPYPIGAAEKSGSQILIDDNNQKWMVAPRNVGLLVFNDNGTLDNKADDQVTLLGQGSGNGNLPNTNVNCIAKDKDGAIWVGTNDGIAIYNCPGSVFNGGCDAELRIVQYDENAGLLFQNENIRTIAVDGANNKWIGTTNGIWQISDDAETILKRFNVDNSPLPADEINKIVIHPVTGDVFIATTGGLVSFRSEATEGFVNSEDILVFPNPVPSNYSGTIAIRGLTENADVRITDVSGQLIYRVKAQGGQAVWNGQTYTGQRPISGVYYVFVTDKNGEETGSTKFIFHE